MPTPIRDSHINVTELRFAMSQRLGPERARNYFGCLERFLSRKLSKSEFDKICYVALGEENIALHNQLIRAIIKNAYQAKAPPLSLHGKDAFHRYPVSAMGAWTNGEIPPPRRCRSGARERRYKDRPSPLGPAGKQSGVPHQCLHDLGSKENGQAGIDEMPSKRQRMEKTSEGDRFSVNSYSSDKVVVTDDVEKGLPTQDVYPTKPLLAPLGIPFCPPSPRGSCRRLASDTESTSISSNCSTGALCHNMDLKKRMDRIVKAQDLGEVSLDSASLLNTGLDSYLTRLIKSCVQLVGSRSGYEPMRNPINKQLPHAKSVNGMWQGNHVQLPGRSTSSEGPSETRTRHLISLQDFKVAMQLNPQQLGGDWPFLLEKIHVHSFDE